METLRHEDRRSSTVSCAPGDSLSVIVQGIPPLRSNERYLLLEVHVEAEMGRGETVTIGKFIAQPAPTQVGRVIACACVPGAIGYRVNWYLRVECSATYPATDFRDYELSVGLYTSPSGSGRFGLDVLDHRDDPGDRSGYVGGFGLTTAFRLSKRPRLVAELYGHNAGAAGTIIQAFDQRVLVTGDIPVDEFYVPSKGNFYRSYPPRPFEVGVILARSSTWGEYTADPSGTSDYRGRFITR